METLWVTFRIKDDSTYSDRYSKLIEAIKHHCTGEWWYEPTSFWLFQSDSTKDQVAETIKKSISPQKDVALVGSMDTTGAALVGTPSEAQSLRKLIPKMRAI